MIRLRKKLRRLQGLCDRYMEHGLLCKLEKDHHGNCERQR